MTAEYDIVIIGGGPGGLAAAVSAAEKGGEALAGRILILERDTRLGGILLQCIHNGFGLHYFGEELTGPEYAGRFVDEVRRLNIDYKTDTMVLSAEVVSSSAAPSSSGERGYDKRIIAINTTDGMMDIRAKAVVFAMGCRERTRGALVIPGTRPAGIFTAGAAQRFVNIDGYLPGKKVVILGSGDIGLIMARRLTLEGAEVKLICEVMPFSSGLTRNIVQCVENFGIPIKFSHTITAIHGRSRVEGVSVCGVDKNRRPLPETEEFIECDTVLLSVGLIPENEISESCGAAIDAATSGPIVNEHMETSLQGVFACGNAVHVHDLVDFVTAESIRAGRGAAEFVRNERFGEQASGAKRRVPVLAGNRVRYTVPQFIDSGETEQPVPIMFRTADEYRNVHIVVYSNGQELHSVRKRIVRPGEMQIVELDPERFSRIRHTLTVSVVLPEEDID